MNELVRSPDRLHHQHLRDIIAKRVRHPTKAGGPVVSDIDLVINQYGPLFNMDPEGRFMFVDFKFGDAIIRGGQKRIFRLIDKQLRSTTYSPERYQGFWVIHWAEDEFGPMFLRAKRQFVANVPDIVGHEKVLAFIERCESPSPIDLWDAA